MSAHATVEERREMNSTDDETRTFRGRTLEEVLPLIKADLGPDAEIVRQREGLMGGVGGFFQRPCIEVDARPGEPEAPAPSRRRFDAYDDEPAMPERFAPDPLDEADEPTTEGLTAPGIQEILRQAAPFADHLNAASLNPPQPDFEPLAQSELETVDEEVDAEPEREPEPRIRQPQLPQPQLKAGAGRPQIAAAIESQLVEAGIATARAAEMVAETVSHVLPFSSPRRLRRLARQALARRIPVAAPPAPGGRSLAFAGPGGSGKTLCTARVAAAYAAGSDLPVVCLALRPADGGAELKSLLEPLGVGVTAVGSGEEARAYVAGALSHALVVVDTPAVSPGSAAEVAMLGDELRTLGVGEVHLTLPATYSAAVAAELAERLDPLGPTHVALTHMDETSHVGGLVDFAIAAGRPLSYTSGGTEVPGGLEPADANDLAALVLP
ncbi:MAG: hypothetical protein QOC95_2637 [Thermoleophilaceae bacterium]|nr:hypothetical protein [Thermoleophilaceae bacterium]